MEQKCSVEAAGARHVIAMEEESFVSRLHEITKGKGIRVIFDAVGGLHVVELADVMSPGGILIAHGMLSSNPTPFPLKTAISKSLTMRGYVFTEVVTNPEHLAGAKRFIFDGLESGHFKPLIAKIFSFDEVQATHHYLESNRQIGKVVVTVP